MSAKMIDADLLIGADYYVNTFCKNYDEACEGLSELKDILDEKGYISIADWHEWEDPSYFEDSSDEERLNYMQIGWTSIDSFSIKPGTAAKPRQLKSFYYIFAEPPARLDNLNEAIDEIIQEKTFNVNILLRQIDELTAMKKGA